MLENLGAVAIFKAPEGLHEVISTEFSRLGYVASGVLHSQFTGQMNI
jgi:hypothetical protein